MAFVSQRHVFYHAHRRRSFLLCLLLALIVLTATLPMSATSVKAQDETGVTATVGANIISLQAGPGLEFNSIGTAKLGQTFPVLGRAHGSNRIWYKIKLPTGDTAWVSERVVNIDPSPDSLPWLGDNDTKIPLVMDCGRFQPILFVGAYAKVIVAQGVILYQDIGVGKREVGGAAQNAVVQVLDGPFCTKLNTDRYQIQWLVLTQVGIKGYMLEGLPNNKGPYVEIADSASASDFPTMGTPDANTTSTASDKHITRPSTISDQDIQNVMNVFDKVQRKMLTQAQAETQLQKIVDDRSAAVLAWIVRNIPIYDGYADGWFSFARYEDETVMKFNLSSELDIHPVKTTLGILFGRYKTPKEIFESMGCGG